MEAESSSEVELPKILIINKKDSVKGITGGLAIKPFITSFITSVSDKEFKVTALVDNVWNIGIIDSDTYRALVLKLNVE